MIFLEAERRGICHPDACPPLEGKSGSRLLLELDTDFCRYDNRIYDASVEEFNLKEINVRITYA